MMSLRKESTCICNKCTQVLAQVQMILMPLNSQAGRRNGMMTVPVAGADWLHHEENTVAFVVCANIQMLSQNLSGSARVAQENLRDPDGTQTILESRASVGGLIRKSDNLTLEIGVRIPESHEFDHMSTLRLAQQDQGCRQILIFHLQQRTWTDHQALAAQPLAVCLHLLRMISLAPRFGLGRLTQVAVVAALTSDRVTCHPVFRNGQLAKTSRIGHNSTSPEVCKSCVPQTIRLYVANYESCTFDGGMLLART